MRVRGTTVVVPPRENGVRLTHLRRFRDRDGQVALRHRDRRHAHIAADDDDAGTLIDDDPRRQIRFDLQLLDLGQERDDVERIFLRQRHDDGRLIDRLGHFGANESR